MYRRTDISRLISEHGNQLPNYADSQFSVWKNVWVSALQKSKVLILGGCL